MVDLSVCLAGLKMDNPVVPASGTFGFGKEFKDFYDINILGSFSFKGTTRDARFGNPTPRIAECESGMINAVGLQNPGVHHVIEHELPEMREYFHKPVIANVSGFSVEDYAYTCSLLDKQEQVGILERYVPHVAEEVVVGDFALANRVGQCGMVEADDVFLVGMAGQFIGYAGIAPQGIVLPGEDEDAVECLIAFQAATQQFPLVEHLVEASPRYLISCGCEF